MIVESATRVVQKNMFYNTFSEKVFSSVNYHDNYHDNYPYVNGLNLLVLNSHTSICIYVLMNYVFSAFQILSKDTFTIRHYDGDVNYTTRDMLSANQDALCDDVIASFSRNSCNFGFVTHLFSSELRALTGKADHEERSGGHD